MSNALSQLVGLMALEGISDGYKCPSCRETFSATTQDSIDRDINKADLKRQRKAERNKAFNNRTTGDSNG